MDNLQGLKCVNPPDSDPGKTPPKVEKPKAPLESPTPDSERWREVAAQAAVETDPRRLSELVDELLRLLDEGRPPKPHDPGR